MPRFFFHTADGTRSVDTTGTELQDHHAARVAAITLAGDMLARQPAVLSGQQDFRVEVTDETNLLLFTIITLAIDSPAVWNGQSSVAAPDRAA